MSARKSTEYWDRQGEYDIGLDGRASGGGAGMSKDDDDDERRLLDSIFTDKKEELDDVWGQGVCKGGCIKVLVPPTNERGRIAKYPSIGWPSDDLEEPKEDDVVYFRAVRFDGERPVARRVRKLPPRPANDLFFPGKWRKADRRISDWQWLCTKHKRGTHNDPRVLRLQVLETFDMEAKCEVRYIPNMPWKEGSSVGLEKGDVVVVSHEKVIMPSEAYIKKLRENMKRDCPEEAPLTVSEVLGKDAWLCAQWDGDTIARVWSTDRQFVARRTGGVVDDETKRHSGEKVIDLNKKIERFRGKSAYAQAFEAVEEAKRKKIMPNVTTWNIVLKKIKSGGLSDYSEVMDAMEKDGIEADVFTWTTIICALAGQKELDGMEEALRRMDGSGVERNIWTWNIVLEAYAKRGDLGRIDEVLEGMKEAGIERDLVTWNSVAKAYEYLGSAEKVEKIMDEMRSRGVEPDVVTWTTLLTCHKIQQDSKKAREVLRRMREEDVEPNSYTWSVAVATFGAVGDVEGAELLFREAMEDGVLPGPVFLTARLTAHVVSGCDLDVVKGLMNSEATVAMWTCVIKEYGKLGKMEIVEEALMEMRKQELRLEVITWNTVADGYRTVGDIEKAEDVLRRMEEEGVKPNEYSWAVLANLYSDVQDVEGVEDVMKRMRESGMVPDLRMWNRLVNVVGRVQGAEKAEKILVRMKEDSVAPNSFVWISLINAYGREKKIDDVTRVFEIGRESCGHDVKLWSALMVASIDAGRKESIWKSLDDMRKLNLRPTHEMYFFVCKRLANLGYASDVKVVMFEEMPKDDLIPERWTWNMYLRALAVIAKAEEAEDVMREMVVRKLEPDPGSWTSLCAAYCAARKARKAEDVVQRMRKVGLAPEIGMWLTLLEVYDRSGDFEGAEKVLHRVDERDLDAVEVWEKVLRAYARNGNVEGVEHVLHRMRSRGVKFTVKTWTAVAMAYARTKDGVRAEDVVERMNAYKLKPDVFLWNTIASAYSRSKDIRRVEEIMAHLGDDGESDSRSLESMNVLAGARSGQGDLEGVKDVFEQMRAREESLSERGFRTVLAYWPRESGVAEFLRTVGEFIPRPMKLRPSSIAVLGRLASCCEDESVVSEFVSGLDPSCKDLAWEKILENLRYQKHAVPKLVECASTAARNACVPEVLHACLVIASERAEQTAVLVGNLLSNEVTFVANYVRVLQILDKVLEALPGPKHDELRASLTQICRWVLDGIDSLDSIESSLHHLKLESSRLEVVADVRSKIHGIRQTSEQSVSKIVSLLFGSGIEETDLSASLLPSTRRPKIGSGGQVEQYRVILKRPSEDEEHVAYGTLSKEQVGRFLSEQELEEETFRKMLSHVRGILTERAVISSNTLESSRVTTLLGTVVCAPAVVLAFRLKESLKYFGEWTREILGEELTKACELEEEEEEEEDDDVLDKKELEDAWIESRWKDMIDALDSIGEGDPEVLGEWDAMEGEGWIVVEEGWSKFLVERFPLGLVHPCVANVTRLADNDLGGFYGEWAKQGVPSQLVKWKAPWSALPRCPLRIVAQMSLDLARGVRHCHEELGIVHRDIKPQNILVSGGEKDPVFRLADFGLAATLVAGVEQPKDVITNLARGLSSEDPQVRRVSKWNIRMVASHLLSAPMGDKMARNGQGRMLFGGRLRDVLDDESDFDEEKIVDMLCQVAEPLEKRRPLINQPNVRNGSGALCGQCPGTYSWMSPELLSLGVSRCEEEDWDRLNRLWQKIGLDKELIRDKRGELIMVSPASDVYSLGLVMMDALLGKNLVELMGTKCPDRFMSAVLANLPTKSHVGIGSDVELVCRAIVERPRKDEDADVERFVSECLFKSERWRSVFGAGDDGPMGLDRIREDSIDIDDFSFWKDVRSHGDDVESERDVEMKVESASSYYRTGASTSTTTTALSIAPPIQSTLKRLDSMPSEASLGAMDDAELKAAELFRSLLQIALACCDPNPFQRPTAREVAAAIRLIAGLERMEDTEGDERKELEGWGTVDDMEEEEKDFPKGMDETQMNRIKDKREGRLGKSDRRPRPPKPPTGELPELRMRHLERKVGMRVETRAKALEKE